MKVRNTRRNSEEKIELQMTPMIDIVFQLLIFFIMTFKIVSQEGDFNIKMPMAAPAEGLPDEDQIPPMKLFLRADSNGNLADVRLNEKGFGNHPTQSFNALNLHLIGFIGSDAGLRESAEIEVAADFQLKYENVIAAVTAVSGYIDDGGNVVKLVEKIKFAPPQRDPGS